MALNFKLEVGNFGINGKCVALQGSTTDLKDLLVNFGFLTDSGKSPLNLDGGALTVGSATLGAGTTTIAPLKFTSGTSLSSPVAGVIEFTTDDFFATITTGTARKAFVLDDGTRLTSGKIPVATTNGRLVNVTAQTELTDELTSITYTAPGTPDYAIQDLVQNTGYGFVTKDEGNTVLSVILNLQTRVNELETKLVALGLLADAD